MVVTHALVDGRQGGPAGRPGPAVPEVRGLFVVGDWIGPEGMLVDASLASARRAADLIGAARAGARRRVTAGVASGALADVYEANERFLWGLCYRHDRLAADADDLVQETFVRALEHPPARTHEPLASVARAGGAEPRTRSPAAPAARRYVGPWLPAPIETGDDESPPAFEPTVSDGIHHRGALRPPGERLAARSCVALEALTPKQRAVLLLRDVFDYPVAETAAALEMSEANVKTTHHRARRAMAAYDRARCIPTRDLRDRTRVRPRALPRRRSPAATRRPSRRSWPRTSG